LRFERVTILLVDDNQHMRILLTEILRAIGVRQVLEAADGDEAMTMLRRHTVDIIITDLAMIPVDGVDFVRLLRNSPDSPNPMCPVIMLSGHSTERRIFAARDAGVNEFLSKPVTVRGILSRIGQIIDHPRPFIRSAEYFGPDRRRRQDPSYQGPRRRSVDNPFEQVLD
jgi:two-component system, chemotaxis family, chemotaxis protein CheY